MKIPKIGLWILIVFITLFLVASVLAPLFMFTIEDKLLADQLSNKYIDSEFDNWKEVNVPGFRSFKIPGQWELRTEDDIYTITDENDDNIAYCALISENNQKFPTYLDFLKVIISYDIAEFTFEYDPDFVIINRSEFGVLTIQGASVESRYTYINIYDDSSAKMLFVFPECEDWRYDALSDIAQAIVYSSCFD